MGAPLTDEPLVSIVIVTWNSARFLPRCLDGVAQQTYRNVEVVLVDNGSTDDSVAIFERRHPDAPQALNTENRGFAVAVNLGVAIATGEFVLLLNPDAFLTPEYVARVVEVFRLAGESFGMATGKLLRGIGESIEPTTEVDSKGIRMTRTGRHLDIGQGEPDVVDDAPFVEVFGVSGAAAMYRATFIDAVRLDHEFLDEDFHTYREDADVAWRGRLFGWRAMLVPRAVAYHVRTVTPAKRRTLPPFINMHSVKNRFLLRLKNEGLYLALRNAPFELPRDLIALGAVLTIERTSLPALSWLWKNRRRIMAKRREIQRRRRVSDRALAGWFR